jgi:hypothetical protein
MAERTGLVARAHLDALKMPDVASEPTGLRVSEPAAD